MKYWKQVYSGWGWAFVNSQHFYCLQGKCQWGKEVTYRRKILDILHWMTFFFFHFLKPSCFTNPGIHRKGIGVGYFILFYIAWIFSQEMCWRQFRGKNAKLCFMRVYHWSEINKYWKRRHHELRSVNSVGSVLVTKQSAQNVTILFLLNMTQKQCTMQHSEECADLPSRERNQPLHQCIQDRSDR